MATWRKLSFKALIALMSSTDYSQRFCKLGVVDHFTSLASYRKNIYGSFRIDTVYRSNTKRTLTYKSVYLGSLEPPNTLSDRRNAIPKSKKTSHHSSVLVFPFCVALLTHRSYPAR